MRKRSLRGFTLIELLIVVVIVGILVLAVIPAVTTDTEEARSSEARATMGTIKDRARAHYQRTNGTGPNSLAELQIDAGLQGAYFDAGDYSLTRAGDQITVRCTGVYTVGIPADLEFTFDAVNGSTAGFNR